jgi:hypothetical protein
VTLDGHVPSRRALWLLRREHSCWRNVKARTCKYLNNIVEQDHRAIKRCCASMAGFKSFANAAITIAGIELAHRIRKGQFSLGRGRRPAPWLVSEGRMGVGTRIGADLELKTASLRPQCPALHRNQALLMPETPMVTNYLLSGLAIAFVAWRVPWAVARTASNPDATRAGRAAGRCPFAR